MFDILLDMCMCGTMNQARMYSPLEVSSMSSISAQPVLCAICVRAIEFDDQNRCKCGEFICESCPAFACSCVDEDPTIRTLLTGLRTSAIELAKLQAEGALMGYDNLTETQTRSLSRLSEIVPSLREQVNVLDQIRGGFISA